MQKNPLHYRIKNWDCFQQYRDRNPPWVKLHYETLSSSDWVGADNETRILMVVCMLVASRHGGQVPNDVGYLKRVGYLNFDPTFDQLLKLGFLIAPKYLRRKDILVRDARPETESDTETEKKEYIDAKRPSPMPEIWPTDIDLQWALNYWREKGRDDLCADVEVHLSECRHYHTEIGTKAKDWPGTWRTWAQRAVRFNRRTEHGTGNSAKRPSATDQHLAGIASLIADARAGRKA